MRMGLNLFCFFFFQAEDGIRNIGVTGVQTCALPISILNWATEEQKARIAPPLASGEELCAFALTEPEAGSDASNLRTKAVDGRITGMKQWITNGSYACTFTVFARPEAGLTPSLVRGRAPRFPLPRGGEEMG